MNLGRLKTGLGNIQMSFGHLKMDFGRLQMNFGNLFYKCRGIQDLLDRMKQTSDGVKLIFGGVKRVSEGHK